MIRNYFKYYMYGVILYALFIRIFYYIVQPDLCSDNILYMATARSFMNGNGVSIPYVNYDDISKITYKTSIESPPAYSVILSLITIITKNFLLSDFIIRIIFIFITFYYCYKILMLYNEIISIRGIIFAVSFIIISSSILNNINTILIPPLSITSASLYYFIRLYNSNLRIKEIIFISLLVSMNVWFHYTYILVPFFIPLVFIRDYIKRKNIQTLKSAIISLLIIVPVISLLLLYNYLEAGNIIYMDASSKWEKGFFVSNLQYFDPIFLSALIKLVYFSNFIKNQQYFFLLSHFISFLIFIALILSFYKFKKVQSRKIINLFHIFFYVAILILFLLIYTSLRYYEVPRPGWSYVGDPRYFSIVYLTIILLLFLLGFNKIYYSSKLAKIIRLMLVFFFMVNFLANILIIKSHFGGKYFDLEFNIEKEPFYDLYHNINSMVNSGKKVVYIDNGATVRQVRIAALAGAIICDSSYFLNNTIRTSEEIICVFYIFTKDSREIDKNLNDFGIENNYYKIGEVFNEPLYNVVLKPKNSSPKE